MKGSVVLLAAVAAGGVFLLFHKGASAAGVPPGWSPPPGSAIVTLPANGPGTIAIKAAGWNAEPGQPPGRFLLLWDPAHPSSFVALFFPAATPNAPAVMAIGSDTNSQLILSTVPNLLAALPANLRAA